MKPKKIFGWILLLAGLVIIFWSLYTSYNIFSAKTEAPQIFKAEEEKEASFLKKETGSLSPQALQEEMEKLVQEQIKEIIPSQFFVRLLNLIGWSIFAGILIFGGGKISAIGIKLIRKD